VNQFFEPKTPLRVWTFVEKNFRRVMGHKDMWALKAILDGKSEKNR